MADLRRLCLPLCQGDRQTAARGAFVLCKYHIHTLHSESRLAICHTCSVGLSSSVSITDGDGAGTMCSAPILHTQACGDLIHFIHSSMRRSHPSYTQECGDLTLLHTRARKDLRTEFLSLACLLASYHNNNRTTPYFKSILSLLFYCCPHAEKGQGIISRTRLTIPRQWDIQTAPSLSCSKLSQELNP